MATSLNTLLSSLEWETEIRSGAALMIYPEVSAIIRAVIDSRSGTPAFKRVPVLVRARQDRLGPDG